MSYIKAFLSIHIIIGSQLIYSTPFDQIKDAMNLYFLKKEIANFRIISSNHYLTNLTNKKTLEALREEAIKVDNKIQNFTTEKYREILKKKKIFYLSLLTVSFPLAKYTSTIFNNSINSLVIYSCATLSTITCLTQISKCESLKGPFGDGIVEVRKKTSETNIEKLNKKIRNAAPNKNTALK